VWRAHSLLRCTRGGEIGLKTKEVTGSTRGDHYYLLGGFRKEKKLRWGELADAGGEMGTESGNGKVDDPVFFF
jgi:hypothetical protein